MLNNTRKKIKIFYIITFSIIMLSIVSYGIYNVYLEVENYLIQFDWIVNFNIKFPHPQEKIEVFYNRGPTGEGHVYSICSFDNKTFEEVLSMSIWKKVDKKTVNKINDIVKRFEYMDFESEGKINLFIKYPLEPTVKDFFYYREKPSKSSIIFLVNMEKKKLFVLEEYY